METCKRCKREFTPTREGVKRCEVCLAKRRSNRIVKRAQAGEEEKIAYSVDKLIRSNGYKKTSNVRMYG